MLDNASLYLLTAEETIAASDILISINSTMLLEAALAGKVAITAKYVEFDQIWDGLKIPVARTQVELEHIIAKSIVEPETFVRSYDPDWASRSFGVGEFDGRAAVRIREVLEQIRSQRFDVQRGYAANRAQLLDRDACNAVACPSCLSISSNWFFESFPRLSRSVSAALGERHKIRQEAHRENKDNCPPAIQFIQIVYRLAVPLPCHVTLDDLSRDAGDDRPAL